MHFYPNEQLMDAGEIYELSKAFVSLGVRKIRLTGGEPLVRKDAGTIIENLSHLPVQLAITTNGYLMDRYLEVFRKNGLSKVNVSLDSLKEGKFSSITGRDYFSKVIENIEKFIEEGFHLKVNVVVSQNINDDELTGFVSWTKDQPVHIRFIEFMPFNGNSWEWNKVVPYKNILERVSDVFPVQRIKDRANDTSKNYRVPGYPGTFAVISSVTNPFCNTCNRLRITADGKMKNCLFSDEEVDLLSIIRHGNDPTALIRECVQNKHEQRGGKKKFQDSTRRPMVAIGG